MTEPETVASPSGDAQPSHALDPSPDVAIVGAGPAGLSAALALRAAGVRSVTVLDREPVPGGIPRHCAHYPYGLREYRRLMKGPDYARETVARAVAAGVRIVAGATVAGIAPGPTLTVSTDAGLTTLTPRRVLLATGVRETARAARLVGGTKPAGVLSTGALQGLVHLEGRRPFRRPIVVGTELVAMSALLTCRHLGIRPRAVVEPASVPAVRWPAFLFPFLVGVPLWTGTEVEAIHGVDRVEAVTLRGPSGKRRVVETDGVVFSGGFRPESTLIREGHLTRDPGTGGPSVDQFGRTSDPTFFAAGNMLRPVETAGWCWREGRAVGTAIARDLADGLPDPETARSLAVPAAGGLKYALPQRIIPGAAGPLDRLQLRVDRPVLGNLHLTGAGGADRHLAVLDSRPERRILLPLPDLADLPAGSVGRLTLEAVV